MVMARLLTPRDYGLIGMVTVITGFLTVFRDIGLSRATVQRPHLTHEEASNLFWINTGVGVVIMLATMALAPVIASFYGEPALMAITVVLATGFFVTGASVQHRALLRRRMRFGVLSLSGVASVVVAIAVGIGMAWYHFSYWAIVGYQLAYTTTGALLSFVFCRWRPSRFTTFGSVRDMLAFGGNVTGFTTLDYFARNTDDLLIGRVWGTQQLGFYAKAYQLLLFPLMQINLPVSGVAVPTLSRLIDEPARYRAAFLRILEKIILVTMPLVAFLYVTSDWVMDVVLGPQWGGAARIFRWLAIAAFVQPVGYTTGWLFTSQNRTRSMLRWGVVSSTIAVVSIAAGLPWGAAGVAASYALASTFITTPLSLMVVGREGPVRATDFYRVIFPFAGAGLFAGAAAYAYRILAAPERPLEGLIVSFVIASAAALAALLATRVGRAALLDMVHSVAHLLPPRTVAD